MSRSASILAGVWVNHALARAVALAAVVAAVAACGSAPVGPGAPAVPPARAALPPAIRADGLPPLPRLAAAPLPPAARVVGWHPHRAELLLALPAGGLEQLHVLVGPGQQPEPLTHEPEPVAEGRWHPRQPGRLVFLSDRGGDEAWRLHVQDFGGKVSASRAFSPAGWRVRDWAFEAEGAAIVAVIESVDGGGDLRGGASRLVRLDPDAVGAAPPRVLFEATGTRLDRLHALPGGDWLSRHTKAEGGVAWRVHPGHGGTPRQLRVADAAQDAGAIGPAAGAAARALWLVDRSRGSDFRHLARLDLDSGRETPLLQGKPADLEAVAAHPSDVRLPLAVVHNEDGLSVLRLLSHSALRQPPAEWPAPLGGLPPGVIAGLVWHPTLPLLALHLRSASSPDRPWVIDFTDVARPQLRAWWPAPEPRHPLTVRTLQWTARDGERITALHVAPPSRFAGPRPVYIWLHGGPASQSRPGPLTSVETVLVHELGMHVIEPNVRGSDGFGARFRGLDDGRLREGAVGDVSALLDLIAQRPDMDASRVIVAGGSYGGYLSLAVAAAEPERIAAAIKRVGITHFVSFLENTQSYRRDNRRAEYGDERDPAMREFLHRISPLTNAHRIRKPLLVVHGRNDPRVPFAEAERIVQAVRGQGVPVWFLAADNEGHGFDRPENREVLQRATVAFIRCWAGVDASGRGSTPSTEEACANR